MPAVKKGPVRQKAKPRKAPARQAASKPQRGGRGLVKPQAVMWTASAVLGVALVGLLATGGRAQALGGGIQRAIAGEFGGAGFKVATVQVEGASRFSVPYILQAAAVRPGQPIFGINLGQVRERVEQVGWVRSVKVVRLLPDTLTITVDERPRLAVWQHAGQISVIDPEGRPIPEADPGLFSDLPLVVGEGANTAASALLPLIESRPRLSQRTEALVRVDERRWDLRMKDGSLIQLPAHGEESALIQLDQLDQRGRLLELGFERVDLRDPEFVAVRPRNAPVGPAPVKVAAKTTPK